MATITVPTTSVWKGYEKIIFRVLFIYFFLQAVPLDWKFYQQLFSVDWSNPFYGDIFNLAHYSPRFFDGPQSFANWGVIFFIAVAGGIAWSYSARDKQTDFNKLYYWIRVIVRYRLAAGILAYGFIKLFPLQSPLPSISNLNTDYGEFNRWKIFSLTLGIVPSYEFFLGLVEVTLGVLLLFRKTASIAAFIIIIFTGNVFVSNVAYDGGEYVYSLYLISLAIFVLAYDLQRIISLLVLQKPTIPNTYKPLFLLPWQKYGRLFLKSAFIFVFILLYGFKTRSGYLHDPYQYPKTKGLPGFSGLYDVSEFKRNQQSVPYSPTDSTRWQDVVFEEWNTISIRSNRPVVPDSTNTDRISAKDNDRRYELEGSASRHYYSYEADTVNQKLLLRNRNRHYAHETLQLNYTKTNNGQLILKGLDQNKDSLYVALDKIDRKYLLHEAAKQGRRRGLKL